jgi:predicted nucleic acid-binding protein
MAEVISNTSPLLYLYRAGVLAWLPDLFGTVGIPDAVIRELEEGHRRGYDVPKVGDYPWLRVLNPRAIPSEWLTLDLGPGELAALALALETPGCVVLLDDGLARRIAYAAGLMVWGTLRIVLEAKARGLTPRVEPFLDLLQDSGMWISAEIRQRILVLAGET